ncbi:10 TM acyl transferase domain found in Cas1p-domain-containing protein, partial [Chytriomyces sp. MP71]
MTHIKQKVEEGIHNHQFAADNFIARLIPPFQEHLLSEERRNTLKNSARHDYNSKLFSLVPHDLPPPLIQLNKIGLHMLTEAPDSFSLDGLHFVPKVDRAEVDILLNQICNPILFAGKKMQGKTSCCVNYPGIPLSVWFIILLTIVFGHGALYLRTSNPAYEPPASLTLFYPTNKTAYAISILGLTLFGCIITDRTQLFIKVNKDFSVVDFVVMNLVWVVPGIWSMRVGSDSTFLNREQTDDWKGWMQASLMCSFDVNKMTNFIPIYSVIRVMVASYLFMTGFGHFSFFYKKADFSLIRLARVLVRLNLLSIALSYTMETDTLFYYFGPLVSFWFLIVWGTMRVYNLACAGQDNPTLLAA